MSKKINDGSVRRKYEFIQANQHNYNTQMMCRLLGVARSGYYDWRRFCLSDNLRPSMSRRGNCWDNAVAESFFSGLKKERIKKRIYRNREVATNDVSDYIESFYNRKRRHQHLGGVSPAEFEATVTGS